MKYLNIKKDNSYVLSEDNVLDRNALINVSKLELSKSKIEIIDLLYSNKQFYMYIKNEDSDVIQFTMFLKNITGAGWKDKLDFKRCQVPNLKIESPDSISIVSNKHYNLILGVYLFDNNPIFVAWDPYRYLNHNTLRSCYVTVDTLKRGYEKEYYEGVVSSQKLWVFKGEKFDQFLKTYINYVSTFYIKE